MSSNNCSSSMLPNVVVARLCVSPLVNSALPCVEGNTLTSHVMGRTVLVSRPSTRRSFSRILVRRMSVWISPIRASINDEALSSLSIIEAKWDLICSFTESIAFPLSNLPPSANAACLIRGYEYSLTSFAYSGSAFFSRSGSLSFPASF